MSSAASVNIFPPVTGAELRDARLALVDATGQVLRNGLGLIGVAAPEKM